MATIVISDTLKDELKEFLKKNRKADLITTYLFFLSKKFNIEPILFIKEKTIYRGVDELVKLLEMNNKLWRETEIKISFGKESVNEATKKIYICPFTGKVFGDNTHPNPQDAIYDWVSKCPENTERIGGLKAKRFFVSEDPEVMRNYIIKRKEPIKKTVYSSVITGKLFNSKKSVLNDFFKNHIKPVPLTDVPRQNRFQIEDTFLQFIQDQLEESRIGSFIEAISSHEDFEKNVDAWLVEESEESSSES